MKTQISFADFFKLSSDLIALDRELDAEGCPVSYRKYIAFKWFNQTISKSTTILQLKTAISDMSLDAKSVFSIWYNNVYGHILYEPPASCFVAMSTPVPIIVTWSPLDSEITMPDITLIQYELKEPLSKLLDTESSLVVGIQKLQELPMAKWVWLAMADFDISVTSFELTRPAYHLSLWHSLQTLEKLLKAVLISFGEAHSALQNHGHNIKNLITALNKYEFSLTDRGIEIAHEISGLVGGPSVRYIDDSLIRQERLDLADRAVRAHHLLLEFFALDAEQIGAILSNGSTDSNFNIYSKNSDLELRQKVHIEHKSMCSHPAYSSPPYALPFRQGITHPIQGRDR